MNIKLAATVAVSAAALGGCASFQDNMQTLSDYAGRAAGATLGAGVGYLACRNASDIQKAACITAGATAGWAIGSLVDKRRAAMKEVAEQENLAVVYQEIDTTNGNKQGLSTTINDESMFPSGSSRLTSNARQKMLRVAEVYREQPQKILIIGHTDATGTSGFNQQLSENRAKTVAALFKQQGIPESNLYFQGVGESRPIADNLTPDSRAKNRRVEIVEITSEAELLAYTNERQLSMDNLKSTVETKPRQVPSRPVATADTASPSSNSPMSKARPASKTSSDKPHLTSSTPKTADAAAVTESLAPNPTIQLGGTPVADADLAFYGALVGGDSAWRRLLPIGTANASNSNQACYQDHYRQSGNVKRLKSGEAIQYGAEDYVTGLNNGVLVSRLEDRVIGLGPVAVTRSLESVSNPTLYIYPAGNGQSPEYKLETAINTYESEDKWLYRAFIKDADSPINCIDIVFNKSSANQADDGRLFYHGEQGLMAANYSPSKPIKN